MKKVQSVMATKVKYYPLVALLLLIYEISTRQVYAVTVWRYQNGDKFENPICTVGCGQVECPEVSQNCRDAGGNMFCEDGCCRCLCNDKSIGSTYVGFKGKPKGKCVKNADLPIVYGFNLTEYDFRLVALKSDGNSCKEQRAPLLNVRDPGSKKIVLCPAHGGVSSSLVADIKSCEAKSDGYKYYRGGYWSDVWDNVQTKSVFALTLYHKSPTVKIQWSNGDRRPNEGYMFSLVTKCTLKNKTTGFVRGLLIFKNNGSSPASTTAPIFPTTAPIFPTTPASRATTMTMSSPSQSIIPMTSYKPTTKTATTEASTTRAGGGVTRSSKGFQFTTIIIAVIAGSVFTFLCMVVACLILMRVRKQRREMEMERSLSDKENPVYGKGVSSTLQLSERQSISAAKSLPREEPLIYQPLVENTRPRGATWSQPEYQPLAVNRYSDITAGNRRMTPPREVPRSSTLGRYASIARETNGFYQPLVKHDPGMPCNRPHVEHDYQECGDDYEEPSAETLPRDPDASDAVPTKNATVEVNDLPPYLEAGCVIKKQMRDLAKHKNCKDTRQRPEDYDYLDVEGNHVDSGKTRLDRQGRLIEPMYHVLEEPEIPISDTL